jgi:hypothetical protein
VSDGGPASVGGYSLISADDLDAAIVLVKNRFKGTVGHIICAKTVTGVPGRE